MTSSLERRLEQLEDAAGAPERFVVVATPPTPEQVARVAALEAEGFRVTTLRDPFSPRPT